MTPSKKKETLPMKMADSGELVAGAWTREQVDLLKRTYANGATDDEMKLFAFRCQRSGLDPFKGQIHFRKHGDGRVVFITGIDGYRTLAEESGLYAGSDEYIYDEGLKEYQHIQTGRPFPTTATATVYKIVAGQRVPFTATARWEEYYPGDKQGFMWRKMKYLMLGKCAEALALRKAFPQKTMDLYIKEEMESVPPENPTARTEMLKETMVNEVASPEDRNYELRIFCNDDAMRLFLIGDLKGIPDPEKPKVVLFEKMTLEDAILRYDDLMNLKPELFQGGDIWMRMLRTSTKEILRDSKKEMESRQESEEE